MTWARDAAMQLRTKICLSISTGPGVCQADFAPFSDTGFCNARKGQGSARHYRAGEGCAFSIRGGSTNSEQGQDYLVTTRIR